MDNSVKTLTPDSQATNTASTSKSILSQKMLTPPWGRLIACIVFTESVDLVQDITKIGKGEDCDIVIFKRNFYKNKVATISKLHFEITKHPDNGIIFITDRSKNGTFINGQKIGKDKMYVLQDDDIISIGTKNLKTYHFKRLCQNTIYLPTELKSKYEYVTLLGKGAAGEVGLYIEKTTCQKIAIKKITKGNYTKSQIHKLNHPLKIQNEINILKSLSHHFVIGMKDIVETPDEVFIVLDYMRGGDLSNRIVSMDTMTESNVKLYFYQMVQAVEYLHMNGIVHRDLKPDNILLYSDEKETLLKVSDFGLSKITEEDENMKTRCGTLYYVAPEVLNNRYKEYDKLVDVWSLGVILFYMLSKELPFRSSDQGILLKQIVTGKYDIYTREWDKISYAVKDLVKRMLNVMPEKRITVKNILQHSWIRKDTTMQYKVSCLVQNFLEGKNYESDKISAELGPPVKKMKVSNSDESSDETRSTN